MTTPGEDQGSRFSLIQGPYFYDDTGVKSSLLRYILIEVRGASRVSRRNYILTIARLCIYAQAQLLHVVPRHTHVVYMTTGTTGTTRGAECLAHSSPGYEHVFFFSLVVDWPMNEHVVIGDTVGCVWILEFQMVKAIRLRGYPIYLQPGYRLLSLWVS